MIEPDATLAAHVAEDAQELLGHVARTKYASNCGRRAHHQQPKEPSWLWAAQERLLCGVRQGPGGRHQEPDEALESHPSKHMEAELGGGPFGLCICICVRMCLCLCRLRTCPCTCICAWVCACTYTCICRYACVSVWIILLIHISTVIFTYLPVSIFEFEYVPDIFIFIYIYIYIYLFIYIYIFIFIYLFIVHKYIIILMIILCDFGSRIQTLGKRRSCPQAVIDPVKPNEP